METAPISDAGSLRRAYSLLGALAVAAAGLTVGLSLAFATSSQTEQYAQEADLVQRSEEVGSAAAVVRADLGVILVLGRSAANGLAVTDLEQALGDMEETTNQLLDRLGRWTTQLGGEHVDVNASAAAVTDSVTAIVTAIRSGDIEAAEAVAVERTLPELDRVSEMVVTERNLAAGRLQALRSSAGTLARFASMGVALIVPAAAFLLFRGAMRRRQRQEQLQSELRQERELVKTKDEFIANLSHELRTPLTGIYGFAVVMDDMLKEGEGSVEHEFLAETTGIILGEAGELNRMVDDLLVAAKSESGGLGLVREDLPVGNVIESSIDLFRRQGHALTVDCQEAVFAIDRHLLGQLVRNLVSNATKHGGPNIEIEGRIEGDIYVVSVIDDGEGVPDDLADRLFSRFVHQGDTPLLTGSIGLGLFISKMLSEAMGGELSYERVGRISIFSVALPIESVDSPGANEAAA
jgi:signal transduction histidine kinase